MARTWPWFLTASTGMNSVYAGVLCPGPCRSLGVYLDQNWNDQDGLVLSGTPWAGFGSYNNTHSDNISRQAMQTVMLQKAGKHQQLSTFGPSLPPAERLSWQQLLETVSSTCTVICPPIDRRVGCPLDCAIEDAINFIPEHTTVQYPCRKPSESAVGAAVAFPSSLVHKTGGVRGGTTIKAAFFCGEGGKIICGHLLRQTARGDTHFRWHVDNDDDNGDKDATTTIVVVLYSSAVPSAIEFRGHGKRKDICAEVEQVCQSIRTGLMYGLCNLNELLPKPMSVIETVTVFRSLQINTSVKALYVHEIQDDHVLDELIVTLRKKTIWALHIAACANVSVSKWETFIAALSDTAVEFMSVPVGGHGKLSEEQKAKMVSIVAVTRHTNKAYIADWTVAKDVCGMWWNPKDASGADVLVCESEESGDEIVPSSVNPDGSGNEDDEEDKSVPSSVSADDSGNEGDKEDELVPSSISADNLLLSANDNDDTEQQREEAMADETDAQSESRVHLFRCTTCRRSVRNMFNKPSVNAKHESFWTQNGNKCIECAAVDTYRCHYSWRHSVKRSESHPCYCKKAFALCTCCMCGNGKEAAECMCGLGAVSAQPLDAQLQWRQKHKLCRPFDYTTKRRKQFHARPLLGKESRSLTRTLEKQETKKGKW